MLTVNPNATVFSEWPSKMSISAAEHFLKVASQQVGQRDINNSFIKAIGELTAEVKRLEDELRRARRDIQVGRRFS